MPQAVNSKSSKIISYVIKLKIEIGRNKLKNCVLYKLAFSLKGMCVDYLTREKQIFFRRLKKIMCSQLQLSSSLGDIYHREM
jgi:hypothetical protein